MQNKKLLMVLVFGLLILGATKSIASLTFSDTAITGSAPSSIDVGAGNTLSLQTTNNGPITTGTGLTTLGGNLNITGNVGIGTTTTSPASSLWTNAKLVVVNGSAGNASSAYGLGISVSSDNTHNALYVSTGGNGSGTTVTGVESNPVSTSGGPTSLVAYLSDPMNISGSVANVFGFKSTYILTSPSVVTNNYGLYTDNPQNFGATLTNNYGIYIVNQTAGTNNFALYSAGGANYFGGNIGVGTTSPTAKLNIKDGKFASTQTTPPTASVTGTGYSGASMVTGSTDTKGGITATVGAAAGTLVVTFQSAYPTAPVCTVTPSTATGQVDVGKMYATTSTSALTINFATSPTGGSETWSYICLQ